MRFPASAISRIWISSGSEDESTLKRSSTAVETLLTFWPPGPDARTNRSSSAASSMEMESVIRTAFELLLRKLRPDWETAYEPCAAGNHAGCADRGRRRPADAATGVSGQTCRLARRVLCPLCARLLRRDSAPADAARCRRRPRRRAYQPARRDHHQCLLAHHGYRRHLRNDRGMGSRPLGSHGAPGMTRVLLALTLTAQLGQLGTAQLQKQCEGAPSP